MARDDRDRITHIEERLSVPPVVGEPTTVEQLEMLADLYVQADSYLPALELIDRILALPEARGLSPARRAALGSKAIACRLAGGDANAALAQARELLVTVNDDLDGAALSVRVQLQCFEALFCLSRYDDAKVSADRALAVAERVGEVRLIAPSLTALGRVAQRLGDTLRARDLFEEAFALYRRLGDEPACAVLRNNLGLLHKNLCEWDTAIAHLRGALEIQRRLGRLAESSMPLMNLGIVYQKLGDWDRALEYYREAEQVALQISQPLMLARVAIGMGNIARFRHRYSEAETLLLGALSRARSCEAVREEVLALEFLGELEYDRDGAERALARYHEALPLAERIAPEGDLVVELERRRAEALLLLGRFDEAEAASERAGRLARRIDDRLEHAVTHRTAGAIAEARGDREGALHSWRIAAKLLTDCRERLELAKTLRMLGRGVHDSQEARRLLYRASALYAELGADAELEECEQDLVHVMAPAAAAPNSAHATGLGRRHRAPSLFASSPGMKRAESLARRAAATELSVLVTGETGTGKELVARTIHALSTRAQRPFLAVNCGALRADLALSQLFGHRKGAFTGAHAEGVGLVEAAHGGTLFLDEVGELPHDVQVTLLRFLETGEYLRLGDTQVRRADVRIIAATNRELRGVEGEKLFRRDLIYRLNEIEIRLPTLRERCEDIVPLARHFLVFYGGLEGARLSAESEAVLRSYAWPGNVRELENVMKRIAAMYGREGEISSEDMLPFLEPGACGNVAPPAADRAATERADILRAFESCGGNRSRAAELLGVSRKTLYARLKRLHIDLE
ncbi:MAG: sigma 54-interacting transcriptional regulator [Candidatus Eisenbacteria bacterium]|uniref:Sigma 54-interacting transcriptional regulator n=1 Tax=Eiseniibacteriota bacterium TaxID=2212470 RepID=A0A849SH67_UNCEI|nr:sigma 54-interacting transcriptional regulator [Candidatus Eisenbacteria bacterium]